MKAGIVSLVVDRDIALIIANSPPVNTIDAAVRKELGERLAEIEARKDIRAAVLLCEGSTFFSGADIGEFSGPPKEEEYRALFNRLEALPFPVVAAMHGTVMGGGLEIALACHYRVAAPKTRFAFPEVTLGIIPGAGGTQRMPRLIGIEATLAMVIDASPVDAARAIELGFVDAVVEGDLRAEAVAYARTLTQVRRTGDRPVEPVDPKTIEGFREQARKRYPNRQAALVAIAAIEASATRPFAQGLRYETELVNQAKATVESKALVHVFFAERETRKIPGIGAGGAAAAGEVRRHRRRRHDGRRHRDLLCERRHPGHAARHQHARTSIAAWRAVGSHLRVDGQARPPDGRGQGQAPRADPRHAGLRRRWRRRRHHRGGVREHGAEEGRSSRSSTAWPSPARSSPPIPRRSTSTRSPRADQAAAGRDRPAFLFAGQRDAAARGGAARPAPRPDVIRTAMELSRPLRKTPRAREGLLRLHRQPDDGRLCARGRAHGAGRRDAARRSTARWSNGAWRWASSPCSTWPVSTSASTCTAPNAGTATRRTRPIYQADFALHEAGRLGQKNGKGYYRYEGRPQAHRRPRGDRDPAGNAPPAERPAARAQRRRKSSSAASIR